MLSRKSRWIGILLLLVAGVTGCKLGSKMSFLGEKSTVTSSDPAVWDEHTVGLPFTYGYAAGIAQAQAEGKPAMIFLTTTWCSWCKKMAEQCLKDPEIRGLLEQNFVLVLVDGDTEPDVKRRLKGSGYPYIAFLSPSEELLAVQSGYAEAPKFKQVVSIALAASQTIK